MPSPPSVKGEVYCFSRRQLIFSFGRRVIYHSKSLRETFRNRFSLSVCLYYDIPTNSWTSFLAHIFDVIIISMDLSQRALQTNGKLFLSNLELVFEFLAKN